MSDTPQKETPPSHWYLYLRILAFLGVPTLAGIKFEDFIRQNFWTALGLVVAYALILLGIGFSLKIWQRLESRWTERAAEGLDSSFIKLLPKYRCYRKHYLQHLIYRHRDFDVKGLSTQGPHALELNDVFVDLKMASQSPHLTQTGVAHRMPESLLTGAHPVWDYFRAEEVQRLAIIGSPGSGKTTLLKHMALALARKNGKGLKNGMAGKLPILLFLRDHASAIQADPSMSLERAVRNAFEKECGPALSPPPGWMEEQLRKKTLPRDAGWAG